MTFLEQLEEKGACRDAREWVTRGKYGPQRAWDRCQMDAWMFWWLRDYDNECLIPKKAINGIRKDLLALLKEVNKDTWQEKRGNVYESLWDLESNLVENILEASGNSLYNPSPMTKAICQIVRKHIPKVPTPKED